MDDWHLGNEPPLYVTTQPSPSMDGHNNNQLVLEQVHVLILDHSCPTSLRFGLGTFFGPDTVNARHLRKICSVGYSVKLPVASDKHAVLAHDTGLLWQLVMPNGKCRYATFSISKQLANSNLMQCTNFVVSPKQTNKQTDKRRALHNVLDRRTKE